MFLSRAMSKVQSLEIEYPPAESSTYAPPGIPATPDRARKLAMDGADASLRRRRPLPPIPRQVRPSLPRLPTFCASHNSVHVPFCPVPDDRANHEVIDIFERLSSDPSSSGSSDESASTDDALTRTDFSLESHRGAPIMWISSFGLDDVTTTQRSDGPDDRHHPLGRSPSLESIDHSPLEVFSPRLPPQPILLGLPESRAISPISLPPLQVGMQQVQGHSEYPPVGTSFLYMTPSHSGDELSEFGSFVGPSSGSSLCLSIGRSSSSTSSRFLNIDERDFEAASNTSMSEVLSRTMSGMSEVSHGLPISIPLDLPALVDAILPKGASSSTGITGIPESNSLPKLQADIFVDKPRWSDPFDQGFVHIDGMPEIALPEPLCAEAAIPPEPDQRRLLPRASIATETLHSLEVGAWWKTCNDQMEYGRRRSVMDVQSALQRDCEV